MAAVKRIEDWLYASVRTHQTVGVETVLSTSKYRALVSEAKARGFLVKFIYVILRDVEMNIERVRLRVAKGGHDVPEAKIRERRTRSFGQMGWFFSNADQAFVFDNSGAKLVRVADKSSNGDIAIHGELIPELGDALKDYIPLGSADPVR